MATQQNFVGRYQAGVVVTVAGGKYSPKNDGSDGFVTFSTLTDLTGAAIGTAGNPLVTSGSASAPIPASTTGTITSVASSATNVLLLAANAGRKGAAFYNESSAVLLLALSASASSATAYTVQIPGGAYYELPYEGAIYTGAINGIWASANGNVRITELS